METISNLDLFRSAMNHPAATYYEVARYINATVEDCMCATGSYLQELLATAKVAD